MYFEIAAITLSPLIPLAIGFIISSLSAPVGLSGAFLILPIQLNYLHFTSLAVSPTNLLFNLISTPLSIWRFYKEKRIFWSLGFLIIISSLPGVLLGMLIRSTWLKETKDFKIFIAIILFLLALRIIMTMFAFGSKAKKTFKAEQQFIANCGRDFICNQKFNLKYLSFDFVGENFKVSNLLIIFISIFVGIIGGIYGIGGGAIMSPALISIARLPVYAIGGASLLATLGSSIFALLGYIILWPLIFNFPPIIPDWKLGLLFGLGGALGAYGGSALQKYISANFLKILLCILIIIQLFNFLY